ncbi:tetratricopeptide repeat protein [Pseudomonas sp. EMN2]|uniref:tetratricopeptide repeat protein n=1 Tax=Pseudomonas sp. EMN2 TaxID=2615212 RepID=UPI00129B4F1F|nr:sel1 repeat family protein [Pseudomonas sp. EMN2]
MLSLVIGSAFLTGCSNEPVVLTYQEPVYASAMAQADQYAESLAPEQVEPSTSVEPLGSGWEEVSTDPAAESSRAAQRAYDLALQDQGPGRITKLVAAADLGSAQANYELAKVYTQGTLAPRDLDAAQRYLEQAAGLNDPEATRVLGWQMVRGDRGQQNLAGGAAVMEVSAKTSARAQRELGMLYANLYDQYKLNDESRGEALLLRAYQSGDAPAALALGKFYIRQARQIEAIAPLSFAAQANDKAAVKLLSTLGAGPAVSNPTPSFQQSAGADRLYQHGLALLLKAHDLEDEAEGYAYLSLASDQDHPLARTELAAVEGVKTQMDRKHGGGWLRSIKDSIASRGADDE